MNVAVLRNIFHQQIIGLLQFLDCRGHGADVADAVFVLGAIDKAVEILAVGADVHVENCGLQPLGVFLADDRFLGGIHAANRRTPAVIAGCVAGTDALNEGDLLRFLAVGNPLDMAEERTGSRQNPLKLNAGDDIFINAVTVFAAESGIKYFKAGRSNDSADFNCFFFKCHIVVDGLGDTGINALVTLGADAAVKAAARLRPWPALR